MKTICGMIVWLALAIPFVTIMTKLWVFVSENQFQQWWLTMIWLLSIPLVTLTLFIVPKEDYIKKDKKKTK